MVEDWSVILQWRSGIYISLAFILRNIIIIIIIIIINSLLCNPLRIRAYKLSIRVIFTSPLTELKTCSTSSGVMCGQHVSCHSRCSLSRPGLSLQITSYPNSPRWWVGIDPLRHGSEPGLQCTGWWLQYVTILFVQSSSYNLVFKT